MTEAIVVLWLVPAEPFRSFLRSLIVHLARENDAPTFAPHLTLGPGDATQLKDFSALSVELDVREIAWSEKYTKTLFVRFNLTAELADLRHSLGMTSADFDPHLSLLYRDLPAAAKQRLALSTELSFSRICFDRIEAVRCATETSSREDVESWQVLASRSLS